MDVYVSSHPWIQRTVSFVRVKVAYFGVPVLWTDENPVMSM